MKYDYVRLFSNYYNGYEVVDIDCGLYEHTTFLNQQLFQGEFTRNYEKDLLWQIKQVVVAEQQERIFEELSLKHMRKLFEENIRIKRCSCTAVDKARNHYPVEMEMRFYHWGTKRMALITCKNLTMIEEKDNKIRERIEQYKNHSISIYDWAKEVRKPIQDIVAKCKIAYADKNKETHRDEIWEVEKKSLRMLHMINDVVDMSAIADGSLELHPVEISLAEETQRIGKAMEEKLAEKNMRLRVYVDNIRFEHIIADAKRVHQVYSNLIETAIDDGYPGTVVKVWIRELEYYNDEKIVLQVTVENEGHGLNQNMIDNMSDPFSKVSGEHIWDVSNEGYELLLAKELVLLQEGHFLIETSKDVGCRMTVSLEREYTDVSQYEVDEALRNLKVMVLHTDAKLANEAVHTLNKMRIEAKAEQIHEFTKLSRRERFEKMRQYDIVTLPRELVDPLQAKGMREYLKEDSPKLIITAYSWDGLDKMDIYDAYMTKPFYASSLCIAMKQALGQLTEEEENEQPLWMVNTNILVMEENEQELERITEILKECGCQLHMAMNGYMAKEMIQRKPEGYFDMVLMDTVMPMLYGYETIDEIKGIPMNYAKNIPIIALSSHDRSRYYKNCKNCQMTECVKMPLSKKEFYRLLRKYLPDKCLQ